MQHVTTQMIADAINELPGLFDSHDIERRVLRNESIAFAQDILLYKLSKDVLQTFSAQFARFVDSTMRGQIEQTGKVCTYNLGGVLSECQQWRKLVSTINGAQSRTK